MCRSLDEMTVAEIQREIDGLDRWIQDPRKYADHAWYERRRELLEQILKERAEEGAYL